MDAMILFEMGKIDIQGFLSRTVSIDDRFSRQDLDDESNIPGSSSEMKSSTLSSLSTNVSNSSHMSSIVKLNPCVVRLKNPKTVLLRPCYHLNICATCWDQIVAYNKLSNDSLNENTKPKCPTCKQEVEQVICNVFIYN